MRFLVYIIALIRDLHKKVGVNMAIYKDPHPTSDGRCWYFKICFKDAFENNKQYRSKKYATKKEATDAERYYFVTSTSKAEDINMTFEELYYAFRKYKDDKVKTTTKYDYDNKAKYIKSFFKIKVSDFNIMQYEE